MSDLTLENLQQFCRTCLKKQTDEIQTKNDQQPQWHHIEKTDNLNIWMEALKSIQELKTTYMLQKQYPQYVCHQCYQNFKQFYIFQEMVTNSSNVLTKLLESGQQQQSENNLHDCISVGEFIIKPKLENDFGMTECSTKSEYALCDVDEVENNVYEGEDHKMMELSEFQNSEIKFNYQYRTPMANLTVSSPLSNNERLHKLEETQQYMQNDISIILENQSKMFELLSQTSQQNVGAIPIFPIKTNEEIKKANDLIKESADTYVAVIRNILFPGSLKQNFHRLFATELILHYNFDGVSSKSSLKKYEYLINAIFEATKKDGYTYKEFTHDMRYSIRIVKNRHFKKLYDIKKKNGAS